MNNDYLLLIDGSSLLSTQFFGSLPRQILFAKTVEEKEKYYDKILQTSDGFYTNGVFGFVKYLLKIIRELKPSHIAIAWDLSRNTFRREIYPEYKANRGETMAPLSDQFAICQEVVKALGIAQFMSGTYEADDFCGTLAEKFKLDIPVFIMTKDNDYLQLVDDKTKLWLMHSSAEKTDELYKKYGIDKSTVNAPDRCFVYDRELIKKEFGIEPENVNSLKGIMGDPSDNIKGVPGVGEATARLLIGKYHTVDGLYKVIDGKDKKELDEIKKLWKEELGINRSPLSYLLKTSDTELVGEKSARLSEELATIKTDIDITGVELSDLSTNIDFENGSKIIKALEFNSVDISDLKNDDKTYEYKNIDVDNLPYSLKEAISEKLISDNGIQLIEKLRQKAESMKVIKKEAEPKIKFETSETNDMDEALKCFEGIKSSGKYVGFDISDEGLTLTSDTKEVFIKKEMFINLDFLKENLDKLFNRCKDTCFVTFSLKEKLTFLMNDYYPNLYDLSVAHYLLNPLATEHNVEAVLDDYPDILSGEDTKLVARAAFLSAPKLFAQIESLGMGDLYKNIEMPLVSTLYEMEERGIGINREELHKYSKELEVLIKNYEEEIYKIAGEEFNINSPKQLGVILFEKLRLPYGKKTKTGYSTSADVLERIRLEDPIVEKVLSYRQVAKLKSTYTDGLEAYIREDGRIHCKLNQLVTATGRLSSTEPNLQNIPIRMELGKKIRKAFIPKEGHVFVDADYSQIELRIMAHLSGDEELIKAYQSEEDIHRITASHVFKVPLDEVTDIQRRNAKAVNFGIIYGISSFGLGENLGISRKDAEKYINDYFKAYPKVKTYLDSLVQKGIEDGYVKTYFGRIRPIPELSSNNFMKRQFGERIAMNSPVQGTAADIIKIAMNNVNKRLKREYPDSKLLLQIHDELLIEAKEEDRLAVAAILKEEMMKAADLKVKLSVEVKFGYDWYDAH